MLSTALIGTKSQEDNDPWALAALWSGKFSVGRDPAGLQLRQKRVTDGKKA